MNDCRYTPIVGPGVDALDQRKEAGALVAPTESEMRQSYEAVREKLFAGIALLTRGNYGRADS